MLTLPISKLQEQFEAGDGQLSLCEVRTRGEGEEATSTFKFITGQIQPVFTFQREYKNSGGDNGTSEATITLE